MMIPVRFYSYKPSHANFFKQAMASIGSQAMILTSATSIGSKNTEIKNSLSHFQSSSGNDVTLEKPNPGMDIDPKSLHGMTLSSVSSLCVVPHCLLQFNLHLPSYTSHSLHNCGYLAIHVLPPSANSVKLGRIFAKGIKYDNTKGEEKLAPTSQELQDGQIFHEMTSPFTEIPCTEWSFKSINEHVKVPILNESETIFICKTQQSFDVDNHEIWVVHVLEIIRNTNYTKSGGLLYFNRGFHRIGSILHE